MLSIFFKKIRFFFIIFFFTFLALGFITYLNYTNKLLQNDNHNSLLNYFKPRYQHYILVNNSFIDQFYSLTERIKYIYNSTDGLNQASKEPLYKLFLTKKHNTFIFDNDYYLFSLNESDDFRLCKISAKIIKNFLKENEVLFCNNTQYPYTHEIVIISSKKQINIKDLNDSFVKEYKNLYYKAFARIRQINPSIKKDGEIFLQLNSNAMSFNQNFLKIDLLKKKSFNNQKYEIIKFDVLLKDYEQFCITDLLICPDIIQFYQRPIYKKIINDDLELKNLLQYKIDIDLLANENLQKKKIAFGMKIINERYEIINNLLNTNFNDFSSEAIQHQLTKLKNNHLIIISILLFGFSFMISLVIFFIISVNKLYK